MLSLAVLLPTLPIIYEDFRYRAIHWIWVALLTCFIISFYPLQWSFIGTNLFFIAVQIIFLSLYFSLKHGEWINITQSYLGIGDIVFFIPLCFLFSPVHLILFFIGSLLLSLLGSSLYPIFSGKKLATIPLAGCMALVLITVQALALWMHFDLRQDAWALDFLNSLQNNKTQ